MSNNQINFALSTDALTTHETDVLVVGICEEALSNEAKILDKAMSGQIEALKDAGDITGKVGSLLPLFNVEGIKAKRLLLVGFGKEEKLNLKNLKKGVTAATNWVKGTKAESVTFALLDRCVEKETSLPALMQAVGSALYIYDECKSEKAPARALKTVHILEKETNDRLENAFNYGKALVSGMNFTKDLGNAPGNVIYPTTLAERAQKLAEEFPSITVKVLDQAEMEKLGMGSLLGVAQGSDEPPKLIVLEYNNEGKEKPVALVGKGVTFDSGGISLKPGAAMDEMKFDMCGAASVLGTFRAVAELGMKLNVVGVIPAVENMPSGKACKPGDVLTSMSGITIENLNTDAEGRLILCDALTYATQYEPEAIVDIATLTGAIIVALGYDVSGLFSNNDALAESLKESAFKADDQVWQFPIWEDTFQDMLESNFADIANISPGRGAGSITAACFLERFVKEIPWAHLDVAGTAWTTGKEKGASARPVPLLLNFLKKYEA